MAEECEFIDTKLHAMQQRVEDRLNEAKQLFAEGKKLGIDDTAGEGGTAEPEGEDAEKNHLLWRGLRVSCGHLYRKIDEECKNLLTFIDGIEVKNFTCTATNQLCKRWREMVIETRCLAHTFLSPFFMCGIPNRDHDFSDLLRLDTALRRILGWPRKP